MGCSLDDFAGCRSVSILASDITRPAPTHLLLPPLIRRLKKLDITNFKIVFGLGTHRRMTDDDIFDLFGINILSSADDHIPQTIDHSEIPVSLNPSQILRMDPAVSNNPLVSFLHFMEADHT